MTNFFASRRLRLLASTSLMEIIVTSVDDTPRDFAMSPSSSVFLPSASAFVNPVNSKFCFTTFFGSTTGADVGATVGVPAPLAPDDPAPLAPDDPAPLAPDDPPC